MVDAIGDSLREAEASLERGAAKEAFISAFGSLEAWISQEAERLLDEAEHLTFNQQLNLLQKESVVNLPVRALIRHIYRCRNVVAHKYSFEPSIPQVRQTIRWVHQITLQNQSVTSVMTNSVISISPEDTIFHAIAIMKENDFSQLPILDKGSVVGFIDEWCILENLSDKESTFNPLDIVSTVASFCEVPSVEPEAHINDVINIFRTKKQTDFVLVNDGYRIVGIITKADLIGLGSKE